MSFSCESTFLLFQEGFLYWGTWIGEDDRPRSWRLQVGPGRGHGKGRGSWRGRGRGRGWGLSRGRGREILED